MTELDTNRDTAPHERGKRQLVGRYIADEIARTEVLPGIWRLTPEEQEQFFPELLSHFRPELHVSQRHTKEIGLKEIRSMGVPELGQVVLALSNFSDDLKRAHG